MQAHLQRMDFANLDRMPTGQLVARASSDTTLVQGLLMFIPMMSGNVLLMVLSLGVMLWLSPPLALVSLIIAPALLIVSYRMRTKIFPATWDAQQREGEVIQIVDEAVNGVRVVKAFGQEQRELERVADSSEDLYGSQMRAVRLTSRYQPLMQAIPAFGQVAILAFGGWLALHGEISLGTFLAFTTYVGQLVSPTRQLAGLLAIGQQARAGVERIFQLLDHDPDIQDAADAVDLPPVAGDIDFVDVGFGYDERRDVLEGFDLSVKAGERVAIVGPSGSGKTTATLLVSRFYEPDRGAVLVDGHDVRGVTLHSLRSQIGVVFEESFLFSDSVESNIAYGRPGASDAEIEAAARVAQARRLHRGAAARLRQRRRRARADALGRPAAADRAGPGDPPGPADPDPRRRDERRRLAHRGGDQRGAADGDGGPDDAARRPPALDPPPRRPRRRRRRGAGDRRRHPRGALRAQRDLPRPADRARRGRRRGGRGPGRGAQRAGRGPDDGGGVERQSGARPRPATTTANCGAPGLGSAEPRRRARQTGGARGGAMAKASRRRRS